MARGRNLVWGLLLLMGWLVSAPTGAAGDTLLPLCTPAYQLQAPTACPNLGPAYYVNRLQEAGYAYPLPPVMTTPLAPTSALVPAEYMRVITATLSVYPHPLTFLAGLPPGRVVEKGFVFVSVLGTVVVEGEQFYQVNPGEYVRAADLQPVRPSSFQGQHFASAPTTPVGWVITRVQPSLSAGQPPPADAAYVERYQPIQVYGVQSVGEWQWYLIGPDQWVEQRNVALAQPTPPPGAPASVIAVDVYEQTLGVYHQGNLIFATLVSSGSRYFPTRLGSFQVWAKIDRGLMSGAYLPDRRDYYYLEDVPWILFYDGHRALHGAYWHDNFGMRSSHGCVNLSPGDARWLFDHTPIGAPVVVFDSQP